MSIQQTKSNVSPAPRERRGPSRRTVLGLMPLAVAATAGAGLGAARLLNPPPSPATPLGAVGALEGGLARIHGIIPLEFVPWTPPAPIAALAAPVAAGGHRVRVILEVTAIDASGVRFNASAFTVEEIAGFRAHPLWASHPGVEVPLGQSRQVTFIFEIPNKAIQLVLRGPQRLRMSLGADHHSNR